MKLQDLFVPALLAFTTVFMMNYFFPSKHLKSNAEIKSGQTFLAASSAYMCKPLNTEIDFFDKIDSMPSLSTVISGYNSTIRLSSHGACISQSDFYKQGTSHPLASIHYGSQSEKESGAFLLALNEMTPYFFTLVDHFNDEDSVIVRYSGITDQANVIKEYRISTIDYRIDLAITIEPLVKNVELQPRIFIPVPFIPVVDVEKVAGIVYNSRGSLEEIKLQDNVNTVWASPNIFGVQGRYFMNALIGDKNSFVQRAYFKSQGKNSVMAILEGPIVQEKTTWNLSFYCGPKEPVSLIAVDKRLESAMGYGWFAPIAKLMMYLLNWAHTYVKSYGWAIILLTIVMRLLMFPFTRGGESTMHKKRHNYERKLAALKQRYKNDPDGLAREQVKLFKEENPFSGSGCLMMLIQMPVFLGLNYALRNSIELYQAPFLWISDLSAPDSYYILPALMGLSMFVTLAERSGDLRKKVAMFIGILLVSGIFAKLSAGLALYLAISIPLGFVLTKIDKMVKV